MNTDNWIKQAENDFFNAVVTGGSLEVIADLAYSYLGNPLMITNERGLIISKAANNKPYNDALFDEFHDKGYVPREKFAMTSVEIFADKMRSGCAIILDPAFVTHRLMIYQDNIGSEFILRCLMLESKRPFSETDKTIFELFARTVQYCLLDSTLVKSFRSNSVEFFFYETLIGHIDCVKNEQEVTEYLGVAAGDHRSLVIAKNIHPSSATISSIEARAVLEQLFPLSVSIIDGDYIVLLVRSDDLTALRRNCERARNFFQQNNLVGCVSRIFESLRTLPEIYRELKDALNLGTQICGDMFLFQYSDIEMISLLSRLSPAERESNCFFPVRDLRDIDRRNNSEYLLTLYAYTLTFGHCSNAARLMGIHYNSMKTRLNRIQEHLGCWLDGLLPTFYISINILLLDKADQAERFIRLEQINRERIESRGCQTNG